MTLAPYWWMENPVGALRHINATQGLPRVTIDYCMYNDEQNRKKPTDYLGRFLVNGNLDQIAATNRGVILILETYIPILNDLLYLES